MIVLDTNVLSEPMRIRPHEAVVAWMTDQPLADTFVTAVSEAEMRYGYELLPAGRRRELLKQQIDVVFGERFKGRVLSFDSAAAAILARIVAEAGHPVDEIDLFDAQLAAIALAHGAIVATRNTSHFAIYGVDLIDPWRLR
jgi:toxin FitB